MRIIPVQQATKPARMAGVRHDDHHSVREQNGEARLVDQLCNSDDPDFAFALLRAFFPEKNKTAQGMSEMT